VSELRLNSFCFEQITEELICIKNFITQDELEQIKEVIDSASQEDWERHYLSSLPDFCMEKFGRKDVENLVAEGKFEITKGWADKTLSLQNHQLVDQLRLRFNSVLFRCSDNLDMSGLATVQRLPSGTELKSHVDQDTDPSIRYASILYLNNDYYAGELFFDNLGISLRPEPRSLLFFPGNSEYRHGVRHVGDGPTRYVVVGFVKEIDFYQKNKY
jgi:hypothetical protein